MGRPASVGEPRHINCQGLLISSALAIIILVSRVRYVFCLATIKSKCTALCVNSSDTAWERARVERVTVIAEIGFMSPVQINQLSKQPRILTHKLNLLAKRFKHMSRWPSPESKRSRTNEHEIPPKFETYTTLSLGLLLLIHTKHSKRLPGQLLEVDIEALSTAIT